MWCHTPTNHPSHSLYPFHLKRGGNLSSDMNRGLRLPHKYGGKLGFEAGLSDFWAWCVCHRTMSGRERCCICIYLPKGGRSQATGDQEEQREESFQKPSYQENPHDVSFKLFLFCVVTDRKKWALRVLQPTKLSNCRIHWQCHVLQPTLLRQVVVKGNWVCAGQGKRDWLEVLPLLSLQIFWISFPFSLNSHLDNCSRLCDYRYLRMTWICSVTTRNNATDAFLLRWKDVHDLWWTE